jgi:ABC-2 type transport system permease protein
MLMSLGYLVLVISAACGPYHAASAAAAFDSSGADLAGWAFAGLPIAVGLAAIATVVPMRVGARHLRGVEF